MPNRPALSGFGATGLYAPPGVGAAASAGGVHHGRRQRDGLGGARSQMDTVTALSGTGPAYFFLFMEALEAAAHERGLPNDIAHKLTLATAFGAAHMARQSREPLALLREQVTSKGGTTAAALAVLDAAGLRATVAHAVAAADRRSAELAAEFGSSRRGTPQPHGSDQIHRRYAAVAVDARVRAAPAVSAGARRFPRPDGGCHRARHQLADPAAAALLPPIGKVDTATVVAVLLVAAAHTEALLALAGVGLGDPLAFRASRSSTWSRWC